MLAGVVPGIRAGKIGTAFNAGLLFTACSMVMDLTNGEIRGNIFSTDPRPQNQHTHVQWLPKAPAPPLPSQGSD